MDNKYPTTSDITISKVAISPVATKYSDGYFVVGVYGGESTVNGTMRYRVIDGADFPTFMKQIYTKGVGDGSIWNALDVGVRNAIFDISSYIKSLRWYPADCGQLVTPEQTIPVGGMIINCPNRPLVDNQLGWQISMSRGMFNIPKHPQARSRGTYCNIAPYSNYKLTYLPFGVFELDSRIVASYDKIYFNVFIDAISGKATLSVYVTNDSQGNPSHLLLTSSCQYGVEIPISVSQTNLPSIASSLAGAGISAMHGNMFSAGVSAISSVCELAVPALENVSSSQGSLIAINYDSNQLRCLFHTIADEDNDCNGRPLCKVRKPSVLGGYIEGEAGTFSAPATIDEMEEVKRFIENGFYYE